jgi:hypothetical protein
MPRNRFLFGIQDHFQVNRNNAAFQAYSELVYGPISRRYLNTLVTVNNGSVLYRVIQIDFQEPLNQTLFHLQRLDTGKFINAVPYGNITRARRVKTIKR